MAWKKPAFTVRCSAKGSYPGRSLGSPSSVNRCVAATPRDLCGATFSRTPAGGLQIAREKGTLLRLFVGLPEVRLHSGATLVDPSNLRVTYSESMASASSGSASAGNPASYQVNNLGFGNLCRVGGTTTITATTDFKQFTITCSGAIGVWGGSGNTLTVRNVLDYAGTMISPNPSSVGF